QGHVLAVVQVAALVLPQAPESDAQDSAIVTQVGDGQPASHVLVARMRVSDVAQPECSGLGLADSSSLQIPSQVDRDGLLVASRRLLQDLPLRIRQRPQRLSLLGNLSPPSS